MHILGAREYSYFYLVVLLLLKTLAKWPMTILTTLRSFKEQSNAIARAYETEGIPKYLLSS